MNRLLDKAKSAIFYNSNAAFLAPIMCSMEFKWDDKIETAVTNGLIIKINPNFFKELSFEERKFVILHEVWHTARLHNIRGENKDHELWNIACDLVINNQLKYNNDFIPKWCVHSNKYSYDTSEEEIYYDLLDDKDKNQGNSSKDKLGNDIQEFGNPNQSNGINQEQKVVNIVSNAMEMAKISDKAGSIPGNLQQFFDNFFKSIVPWQTILQNYLKDLDEEIYSWKRPNRRYQDIYLPSLVQDEGRLEHLAFFLDVSGSIDDAQLQRFNSEVKYIQEIMRPKKLTLIQFDTDIQKIDVLTEDDKFNKLNVVGRGGTSLECVHDWIVKNKPTCSVIFSDLYCEPMEDPKIPIIWVIIDSEIQPEFGKCIFINK